MPPPIGPSSELTHAGRPYELTLLVSTVLVDTVIFRFVEIAFCFLSVNFCEKCPKFVVFAFIYLGGGHIKEIGLALLLFVRKPRHVEKFWKRQLTESGKVC